MKKMIVLAFLVSASLAACSKSKPAPTTPSTTTEEKAADPAATPAEGSATPTETPAEGAGGGADPCAGQ